VGDGEGDAGGSGTSALSGLSVGSLLSGGAGRSGGSSGATLRRGSAVALGVGLTLVAADEERGSSDDGVASGAGVEGDQADPRVVSDGAEVGHASGDVVVELVDVAHDGHHGDDASCGGAEGDRRDGSDEC